MGMELLADGEGEKGEAEHDADVAYKRENPHGGQRVETVDVKKVLGRDEVRARWLVYWARESCIS
jgi:hypothetical protein